MYEYTLMTDAATLHPYMVREKKIDYQNMKQIDNPDEIVRLVNTVFRLDERAEEHVYLITMNSRCDVTGVFLIGKGDSTTSICSVRDMMQRVLLSGANGFVVVHNHPGGDMTPSSFDEKLTKRAATVGMLFQVQLLDSIIVTRNGWLSFKMSLPDVLEPYEVPNEWIK